MAIFSREVAMFGRGVAIFCCGVVMFGLGVAIFCHGHLWSRCGWLSLVVEWASLLSL